MVKLVYGVRAYTYDGRKLIKVLRQDSDGDYLVELTELEPEPGVAYHSRFTKLTMDQIRNYFGCKRREKLIIAE